VRTRRLIFAASFCTLLLLCAGSANADTYLFGGSEGNIPGATLTINGTPFSAVSQGWWATSEPNVPENTNYFVGDDIEYPDWLNNFFTFDLSEFNGGATSAALSIDTSTTDAQNLPVTYSLFDVSTDAATLDAVGGASATIFNDLGSGNSYGQVFVSSYPSVSLDIALNS